MRLRVGHQHSQFWPILSCFMDYYSLFWGPGVFSTIYEPWGAFACRSSALTVLADSGRFVDYNSLYCGPGVISMINEHRDAFTCWSKTLTVLADSGPIRGLLVTVLGSQSDFHD